MYTGIVARRFGRTCLPMTTIPPASSILHLQECPLGRDILKIGILYIYQWRKRTTKMHNKNANVNEPKTSQKALKVGRECQKNANDFHKFCSQDIALETMVGNHSRFKKFARTTCYVRNHPSPDFVFINHWESNFLTSNNNRK